jgi:glycosyltransferase involved in cell wall biosynthesis
MMRVGIAIPSYRGASLIEATLRSVVDQSHQDWRCVVVNDGDEDGTAEVIRRLGDPRIRYVCDSRRRGQLRNFNKAMLETLREDPQVIRLLSADDILYPSNLADIVRVFERYPNVGLVSSHFDGIDAEDGT